MNILNSLINYGTIEYPRINYFLREVYWTVRLLKHPYIYIQYTGFLTWKCLVAASSAFLKAVTLLMEAGRAWKGGTVAVAGAAAARREGRLELRAGAMGLKGGTTWNTGQQLDCNLRASCFVSMDYVTFLHKTNNIVCCANPRSVVFSYSSLLNWPKVFIEQLLMFLSTLQKCFVSFNHVGIRAGIKWLTQDKLLAINRNFSFTLFIFNPASHAVF